MDKLKRSHKNLMVIEAGFIYCHRHNLDNKTFIDDVFLTEDFESCDGSEFDNLCKDLRFYRHYEDYEPITITESEYNMCINEFGKD